MHSLPTNFRNNFHLLRHLGAFLVLYAHTITAFGGSEFVYDLTRERLELSSLGVNIFFIISGWLVMQSRLQTRGRLLFARKRWLRLWPAVFIVTCLLTFVLGPLFSVLSPGQYLANSQTWQFFFRNILFLPVYQLPGVFNGQAVNSPFWTLFFEAICYGCLFVVNTNILSRYRRLFLIFWALLAVMRYWPGQIFEWPTLLQSYHYGITNMMFLFFSAAIWRLNTTKNRTPSKIGMLVALAVFTISIFFPFPRAFGLLLRDIGLLVFVIEWGRANAVITWPSWDISYGTYLIAYPVQMCLVQLWPKYWNALAVFIATLLITIPLAFASWYFVEEPALQHKYPRDKTSIN